MVEYKNKLTEEQINKAVNIYLSNIMPWRQEDFKKSFNIGFKFAEEYYLKQIEDITKNMMEIVIENQGLKLFKDRYEQSSNI